MTRRNLDRDALVAAVAAAWNALPARDKPALMLAHPELYSAVVWLAAMEAVRTTPKRNRRKPPARRLRFWRLTH